MLYRPYEASQLPSLLTSIHQKKISAEVHLKTSIHGRACEFYIVTQNGAIAFCGTRQPDVHYFAQLMKQKCNSEWLNLAMESSLGVSLNEMTPQRFLSRLVEMHLLEWQDIKAILLSTIALALEAIIDLPGEFQLTVTQIEQDYVEIDWDAVKTTLQKRQQLWAGIKALPKGIHEILGVTRQGILALEKNQTPGSEYYPLFQLLENRLDEQIDLVELSQRFNTDPLRLFKQMMPALEKGWLSLGNTSHSHPDSREKATILVVDDSDVMRKILKQMLKGKYTVHQASTSMEALAFLNYDHADLMLLDVSMPDIDGLQLCKSIRNLPQYREFPIIMVTARDGFFDKVKGRMAGATEYLTKPFEKDELMEVVGEYINSALTKATVSGVC